MPRRGTEATRVDPRETRAATAFRNIAARLEGEDVPLVSLDGVEEGFLSRLAGLFKAAPSQGGGT